MRISDWSSDVCSSDLDRVADRAQLFQRRAIAMLLQPKALAQHFLHGLAHGVVVDAGDGLDFGPGVAQSRLQAVGDRKSGVSGMGDAVRVDHGGRRIVQKKKTKAQPQETCKSKTQ